MFSLPSKEQCKQNASRLTQIWIKSSDSPLEDATLQEATRFFQKCLAFHRLPFEKNEQLFDILSSGNLLSYSSLTRQKTGCPWGAATQDLDISLGLDEYVFLSFATPGVPTGFNAVLFAFSLPTLFENFRYPDGWASWNDIMAHAENLFGESFFWFDEEVTRRKDLKEALISEYANHIFLLEDLPKVAASFASAFYNHYTQAIIKDWQNGFRQLYCRGPEIKIFKCLPLSLASFCFVNPVNKRLINTLRSKNLLPPNCNLVVDVYFHGEEGKKQFLKDFYTDA